MDAIVALLGLVGVYGIMSLLNHHDIISDDSMAFASLKFLAGGLIITVLGIGCALPWFNCPQYFFVGKLTKQYDTVRCTFLHIGEPAEWQAELGITSCKD